MNATYTLAKIDRARIMLAEACTLPEVKKIRDMAEAVKVYVRAEKMGIEIQNYAGEIVAEATRRMGEYLLKMEKQAGARGIGKKVEFPLGTPLPPMLEHLGISKKQSAICQDIARLPEEKFQEHINAVKESGQVITTGALAMAAKQHKRKVEYESKPRPIVNLSPAILLLRASAFQMPLGDKSVQAIVTSPPYFGLREYHGNQGTDPFGQETTVDAYVDKSVQVLKECRRVLRDDGIVFWNIADSYANPKGGLSLVPERVVLAAQQDGWCVRSVIVWAKSNPMPESVKNRPTRAYEEILMLTKSNKYFWDADAALEPLAESSIERYKMRDARTSTRNDIKYDRSMGKCPSDYKRGQGAVASRGNNADGLCVGGDSDGRNMRNVWTFAVPHVRDQHFATFPEELPRRCIAVGSRPGDIILDPFCGSGTTGLVAQSLQRRFVGLDLAYHDIAKRRIAESSEEKAA